MLSCVSHGSFQAGPFQTEKGGRSGPALEWRTTQWICRIQIFRAVPFRSRPKGVAGVSCGKQNKKLSNLLEASSIQTPVAVEMRDGTATITLHLMMRFGARIPSVAEKVQENVKNAVQNMTNVTVSRVNLVIAGLADADAEQQ